MSVMQVLEDLQNIVGECTQADLDALEQVIYIESVERYLQECGVPKSFGMPLSERLGLNLMERNTDADY